ncbi:transcriptional regulator with XRE-family HTH domain [Paenibacillus sp. DS2363]
MDVERGNSVFLEGGIFLSIIDKTIRTEFLHYIEENKILLYHFAEKSGINSGTLSRVINGSQPVSVKILDIMTEYMGLEEGYFYEQYVSELFDDSTMNWRRLRPFITRCAELGKNDCIERTVDLMMENPSYIKPLFDCAESFNAEGSAEAALIIYRKVCEGERYQHAERLAICQYRIFTLSINDDQQNNLECAVQFDPYVVRLNELDQLDALKDLMNLYLSLRRWDKAEQLATRMGKLARVQYKIKHQRIRRGKSYQEPSKPLFGYILYSDLIKGSIAEEQNDYNQALHYVSFYENQDWIMENDLEAELTKKQFREWAVANRYLYQILAGKIDVLDEYVEYLSVRENEILRGMFKLIKAANTYNMNIDHVLERFKINISSQMFTQENVGSYTDQIIDDRFAIFLMDVGDYYLSSNRVHIGVQFVLDSLSIIDRINNDANVMSRLLRVQLKRLLL